MPRAERRKSESGVYHVMLRGINRQQIFYDEEDNAYFIQLLKRIKETSSFELYAYCLMGNHVHLLLKVGKDPIETIFRRLGAAFVYWYNIKYARVGHLFQDRFKSEPVDDDRYFLTVLRYILQNPVKAGLCRTPENYPYSSVREYLKGSDGVTDTAFAFSICGAAQLAEFIRQKNDDRCMENDDTPAVRLTDADAARAIVKEFGTLTPDVGTTKDRSTLNTSIRQILKAGVSIRQLSRLTGLSKKIIESSKK